LEDWFTSIAKFAFSCFFGCSSSGTSDGEGEILSPSSVHNHWSFPAWMTQVEESIAEAQEVCVADETSGECRVAWDKVEELSAEVAHRRTREQSKGVDPLVEFCKEAPEADECRVYEDWDLPFHFGDSYIAAGMSTVFPTVFPITVFLCNVVW